MGEFVATPSAGAISMLDLYRCLCQRPTANPPTNLNLAMMNSHARRLIPIDNVWVTNNATMDMDSYRNRRGMLTAITSGYKYLSSYGRHYHGWSVRSGNQTNPMGTGPAAGYNFALTTGGVVRHLNLQTCYFYRDRNDGNATIAGLRIEVVGGTNYGTTWGAATVWLYFPNSFGGNWYSLKSRSAGQIGSDATYWDFDMIGNSGLLAASAQEGIKFYISITFENY